MTDVAPIPGAIETPGVERPGAPGAATGSGPDAVPGGRLAGGPTGTLPLEALHDVELNVEVVLGRARLPLRELLAARPRTTIELDRQVRSAVDVMVNGTLFARGELVVVDDSQVGVQITEIVGMDAPAGGS